MRWQSVVMTVSQIKSHKQIFAGMNHHPYHWFDCVTEIFFYNIFQGNRP